MKYWTMQDSKWRFSSIFLNSTKILALIGILLFLYGCEKKTNMQTEVKAVELSNTQIWIVHCFSTNNDSINVFVIEENTNRGKMSISTQYQEENNTLLYNSQNVKDEYLNLKGMYVVEEGKLVVVTEF